MENIIKEITFQNNENKNQLEKVNSYIKQHKEQMTQSKNRNKFHLMPQVGWMNDPNGFSYYQGEYHMFYQYYPFDVKWGPMHWGHAKSKDLITWEYLPVALAPDELYDKDGCFSGSAIQVEDKHVLMYTGHMVNTLAENKEEIRQVQCLAIGDGVTYHKVEANPIISSDEIPKHSSLADFRDPKIWRKDNMFYVVIGLRDDDNSGKIACYKSENLINWTFVGFLDHSKHELGKMWECPDLFELDNMDVLLMSPQELHEEPYRYKNGNTTTYFIGHFDYESAKFTKISYDEIDYGLDFYAPQTTLAPDGRRIMMAWMQSWDRNIPSDKFGWTGSMTLPRELKIKNQKLYQLPIKEIEMYREDYVFYEQIKVCEVTELPSISGRHLELDMTLNLQKAQEFIIKLLKGSDEETVISFNAKTSVLRFDRQNSGSGIDQNKPLNCREMPVRLIDNLLKLRIFIDTYAIEVFAQDGEYAMTSTVYSKEESNKIQFIADHDVVMDIHKWNLKFN